MEMICAACGADISLEPNVGWVDVLSGDLGGTYDICSAAPADGPHVPESNVDE